MHEVTRLTAADAAAFPSATLHPNAVKQVLDAIEEASIQPIPLV